MKPAFACGTCRFGPMLLAAVFAAFHSAHAFVCPQDPAYSTLTFERVETNLFRLKLNAALPNVYLIQRSTNLANWQAAATNVVLGGAADPVLLRFDGNMGYARVIQPDPPHVAGRLLIRFVPGTTPAQQQAVLQSVSATNTGLLQPPAMVTNGTPPFVIAHTSLSAPEASRALATNPAVRMVEPDWIVTTQVMPNDPWLTNAGRYWNLGCSTCPSPLSSGQGSQAAAAWSMGYIGSPSVIVGIVDEGIEFMHPDLAQNMWLNPEESGAKAANGSDDDLNGYPDDERGWNYFLPNYDDCSIAANGNSTVFAGGTDPTLDTHGTHVAGIIGARGNNGVGQAGVCWQVTMVPVKFLGPRGGSSSCAALGIDYLTSLKRRGSNIVAINASWGGANPSPALHESLIRAAKQDILIVVAAGNCARNLDVEPFYPACYDTTRMAENGTETAAGYDAVITVAAIDSTGELAGFSNYGRQNVDLGAPGTEIYSTMANSYASKSGTSMAAAHVTGALALYAAAYPNTTAQQRKAALLNSTMPRPSLSTTTVTGGRLDIARLLSRPPGCSAPDCILYVDRAYTGAVETGCLATPYKTVNQAHAAAQNGCALRIAAGNYAIGAELVPNKSVLLEPIGGAVLLQPE